MKMAAIMATPSTQSTWGCPGFRAEPESWEKPRAQEVIAATNRMILDGTTVSGGSDQTLR